MSPETNNANLSGQVELDPRSDLGAAEPAAGEFSEQTNFAATDTASGQSDGSMGLGSAYYPPVMSATDKEEAVQLKKSKRAKIILITVIVILFLALAGLVFLGYTVWMEGVGNPSGGITSNNSLTDTEIDDISAPGELKYETTTIPNLTGLFGLSAEEVATKLGPGFVLKSSVATTDASNPAIKQLATFTFTPAVLDGSDANASKTALPTESIYASLDEGGKVIDVYYSSNLQLLGYAEEAFDSLLSSADIVTNTLAAAGVEPKDFSFSTPTEEANVYDNKESANRRIVKQTQIYSGRTTSTTNPTAWTLTVIYDYGLTGVTSSSEFRQATKTINLKLA